MKIFLARFLILLALLAVLTGCTAPNGEETPVTIPQTAATSTPEEETTPADAATPTAAVEPGVTFRNPVFRHDFPDPHIILVDGVYYAYATNSAGRNIQVATSENLIDWQLLPDGMPAMPRWAQLRSGFIWAPEVLQVNDQFLIYYTARDRESDRQCIGVAISDQPQGRFVDPNTEPLICQADEGGSIDASPFRDGDQLYLYWKNDGNCCAIPTWIYVQELSDDGLTLLGEPTQLIVNDRVWEGSVIEAPSMIERDGVYYLFYSANSYGGAEYAVGYATCETATGPCEKAPENPILSSLLENPPVIGPGHQTFVEVDGDLWIVYHAWEVTSQGHRSDRRFMWMDRMDWEDGRPVVRGPTTGVQPVP
jgi:beta-xylosidase